MFVHVFPGRKLEECNCNEITPGSVLPVARDMCGLDDQIQPSAVSRMNSHSPSFWQRANCTGKCSINQPFYPLG